MALIDDILLLFWSSSPNCIKKLGFLLPLDLLWFLPFTHLHRSECWSSKVLSMAMACRGAPLVLEGEGSCPLATASSSLLCQQHTQPNMMGDDFGDVLIGWVCLERFSHFFLIVWLCFMFNLWVFPLKTKLELDTIFLNGVHMN